MLAAFAAFYCVRATAAGKGPEFPLGVWYEGGVGAFRDDLIPADPALAAPIYLKHFRDMAAHGINCAVVPNTPPDHHQAILDAARSADVKLIIEVNKEGGDLGTMIRGGKPVSEAAINATLTRDLRPVMDHAALWRVQLLDEPPPGTFPRYAEVAKGLKAYARRLKPFTCLIGADGFDEFLKTTGSDVAAFDRYPIGVGTPLGDVAAMRDFERVATKAGLACAKTGAASWAVMQVHAITGIHRFPTPGEIRCMTYLALASGSKGLFWFLYQTEYWNKAKGEMMSGLIDTDGDGDARWEEVGRLTKETRALEPTLLRLTPIASPEDTRPHATTHYLKDRKGRRYVFTVNLDTVSARDVETRIQLPNGESSAVTRLPGGKRVAARRQNGGLVWSERLPAGSGALYRLD
jgi:hypothetical protein